MRTIARYPNGLTPAQIAEITCVNDRTARRHCEALINPTDRNGGAYRLGEPPLLVAQKVGRTFLYTIAENAKQLPFVKEWLERRENGRDPVIIEGQADQLGGHDVQLRGHSDQLDGQEPVTMSSLAVMLSSWMRSVERILDRLTRIVDRLSGQRVQLNGHNDRSTGQEADTVTVSRDAARQNPQMIDWRERWAAARSEMESRLPNLTVMTALRPLGIGCENNVVIVSTKSDMLTDLFEQIRPIFTEVIHRHGFDGVAHDHDLNDHNDEDEDENDHHHDITTITQFRQALFFAGCDEDQVAELAQTDTAHQGAAIVSAYVDAILRDVNNPNSKIEKYSPGLLASRIRNPRRFRVDASDYSADPRQVRELLDGVWALRKPKKRRGRRR